MPFELEGSRLFISQEVINYATFANNIVKSEAYFVLKCPLSIMDKFQLGFENVGQFDTILIYF